MNTPDERNLIPCGKQRLLIVDDESAIRSVFSKVLAYGFPGFIIDLAVNGAEALKTLGLPAIPLFASFILLTASINLLMGSASAKWALMAPVFVPMFMLLGYSPELTQTAYRVGDSVTNIISPMMSYFALIIAFFQKYEPRTGLGTIVAVMLPYSVTFLIGWSMVFALWLTFGLPIGPDSPLIYPAAKSQLGG